MESITEVKNMRIDVLGVGFDNLTMTEAVSRGAALLEEPGCHYVVTPNPEIVEVCRENPAAMQAVNGADLVLPDGIGVVKGAAMLGTPLKEKTPGIEFAAGLMGKMAESGRSLYLLGAKPGVADLAAERLQNKWLDILCDEVRHDKGYSGREMKAVMPKIAAEFAAIPVRRVPKVKVGVVGEIYVKYSPLGNNELEKFLASQDCEVNLPGLMGFVQYCAYNMAETVRLYGGSLVEKTAAEAALTLIAGMEKVIIKTLKDAGYHAPMPFSELIKLPEQSHTIGMGCKMGEGWLLTAEMLELVRSGYENIVCAQPFGCLPNHICGKGMVNKIRELYPEANITPIDYDPSATRVNQENRIKLMLAVARERLSERREPPADLPKVRTSVSAKLTKPKSLCANI